MTAAALPPTFSLQQHCAAKAISLLLSRDPMRRLGTGMGFEGVLLQMLIESSGQGGDFQTSRKCQNIFAAISEGEGGMDPRSLRELLQECSGNHFYHGVSALYRRRFDSFWEWYSSKTLWERDARETFPIVHRHFLRGMGLESIAQLLNGTVHTAGLQDIRLVRKVVSVALDIQRTIPQEKEMAKMRLERSALNIIRRGQGLNTGDIFNLLLLEPDLGFQSFVESCRSGRLQMQIVSRGAMEAIAQGKNIRSSSLGEALFVRGLGVKDVIFVSSMPVVDASDADQENALFDALIRRLRHVTHEIEHWRHFSGEGAIPFPCTTWEQHFISEIMAYLEEYRWSCHYFERDDEMVARQLGLTLVQYYRNIAEENYMGS